MAYYIISFDSGTMEAFQKRMPFLEDAVWIEEKKNLAEIKSSNSEETFFFVYLSGHREEIDEQVLIIRDTLTKAKIIYVVEEGKLQDQKAHQLTPVGGDAYISVRTTPQDLMYILEGLCPPDMNQHGNRLESGALGSISTQGIDELCNHPKSKELDEIFSEVFGNKSKKPLWQSASNLVSEAVPDELNLKDSGDKDMSDKDQELSLDDLGDLELTSEAEAESAPVEDAGMELSLDDDMGLDLSAPDELPQESAVEDPGLELSLDEEFSLDESADDLSIGAEDESDELSLDSGDDVGDESLSLGEDDLGADEGEDISFSLDEEAAPDLDLTSPEGDDVSLDLGEDDALTLSDDMDLGAADDVDLSDDAKEKLKEIDAIMDHDASQVAIKMDQASADDADVGYSMNASENDLDTSLVSDDLDLGSINFNSEDEGSPVKEEKGKKKTKEVREVYDGDVGRELKEISGAYSGEMERMQATISNLRSDREELLSKIQKMEDEKVMQNRQALTIRAELDEKKIELSIIRKKLNDEITELKDRLKLQEERKLILEEKNKVLMSELDKAAQKNKIDVKKVQMRERELEQKLELLKADSETQIRHRDLKILELKRKIDAMEFDMESISVQEKRSVESRFELEDKLDKAIKTLRNAISVLEDESDKTGVLEALKKNIDM